MRSRSRRRGGADAVLFAASVLAADVAAGLAARLDAGLNWDSSISSSRATSSSASGRRSGTRARRRRVDKLAAPRNGAIRRRGRRGDRRCRRGRVVRAHVLGLLDARDARRTDAGGVERTDRSRNATSSSPEAAGWVLPTRSRSSRSSPGRSEARSPRRARSSTPAGTVCDAGGSDGQDRLAEALRGVRDLRGDPAQSRDAERAGAIVAINKDPERADLRLLRLRRHRRPASDRPQADRARTHPPGELEGVNVRSTNVAARSGRL